MLAIELVTDPTSKAPNAALAQQVLDRALRHILSHLGLPTEVPAARPARPPPLNVRC
jgi:4-aminobutyrate aminotransferase-like enzyme